MKQARGVSKAAQWGGWMATSWKVVEATSWKVVVVKGWIAWEAADLGVVALEIASWQSPKRRLPP